MFLQISTVNGSRRGDSTLKAVTTTFHTPSTCAFRYGNSEAVRSRCTIKLLLRSPNSAPKIILKAATILKTVCDQRSVTSTFLPQTFKAIMLTPPQLPLIPGKHELHTKELKERGNNATIERYEESSSGKPLATRSTCKQFIPLKIQNKRGCWVMHW